MRILLQLSFLALTCFHLAFGQVVTAVPVFPKETDQVVITFNATQGTGGLAGFTGDVYAHTGVITNLSSSSSDWKYVVAPWGSTNEKIKLTRTATNTYQLTIGTSIRSFYNVPANEKILKMAFVFRNASGSLEGKGPGGADIFVDVFQEGFALALTAPTSNSFLVNQNENINITANASASATFSLTVNGVAVPAGAASNVSQYSYSLNVPQSDGTYEVVLKGTDANNDTDEASFTYTLRTNTVNQTRPPGIKQGINYHDDPTKVTLCLIAPNKSSVYAIGDFSDWALRSEYQMKKDGELFWIEIDELTPGEEYAFQYVVNETIRVADPYADKVLVSSDKDIPDNIYPDLKTFPSKVNNVVPFYNTVSVFQTDQQPFFWQHNNFQKPPKSQLVIYELLIRDFFGNGQETYANLIDTLSYIKSLGVNAIELMPVTEYAGNNSWGYNPNFMFAPDKAHGTKNDLKAFIDAAHGLGMAVILDMVLNQQDFPAPFAIMYMNLNTSNYYSSTISASNPWFNVSATHPFSVFFDMNHESQYTKAFIDTVNHYWLNEYRFDGFRFDLSKGFTQTNSGGNVGAWGNYDQSRVNILTRMANEIWSHTPNAYVILEHFASNSEETTLANNGMMLWGNMHGNYKELILGFEGGGSNIDWVLHSNRGWSQPNVVAYMESHDEERQIYEALLYANQNGYNARSLQKAMDRMVAASAFLFPIPGPKMLWQFGELGYDLSINRCEDGTVNNCRTAPKPSPWDDSEGYNYYGDIFRNKMMQQMAAIMKLKTSYNVFSTGTTTITGGNSLKKQISIRNQANTNVPSNPSQMNVVIVGNFDVFSSDIQVNFQHTGTWYKYFEGESINVVNNTTTINLAPGAFIIFTDVQLEKPEIVLSAEDEMNTELTLYPNPTSGTVNVQLSADEVLYYSLYDLGGKVTLRGKFKSGDTTLDLSAQQRGLYLLEVITRSGERHFSKLVKQ